MKYATEIPDTNQANNSVEEYIHLFPYQETYNYAVAYTGGNPDPNEFSPGDPSKFNKWVLGEEPELVTHENDTVVRMNNDTFYKLAFVLLDQGPVILEATAPSVERFNSFQLMDDRNVNFRNLIYPSGSYTLYYGEKPSGIVGTAIEVPSKLAVVIVRVEVKNKKDDADVEDAKAVFNGIKIVGATIQEFPELDLLSKFTQDVVEEANSQIDEVFETTPFNDLVAGPSDVPDKVSELNLAAGTKHGWGGPVTSHSAYEVMFQDAKGKTLDASQGTYTLTTTEPPVDAFWSVTAYDSSDGHFHPNDEKRYHINNTTAITNEDGSVTFLFKTKCEQGDVNCLEVPEGPFDITARYYLPDCPIRTGEWTIPRPELVKR